MALHMVDDPDGQDEYVDDNSGGGGRNTGGGGGMNIGGLLSFLPIIIGLFRGRGNSSSPNPDGSQPKKGCGGKSMILLLIVGVAAYFIFFKGGCNMLKQTAGGGGNKTFTESGYSFNENETRKAQVYEGLEDDNVKNPLPEAVSLAAYAPNRQNQGKQGSCVAWSSAYAARTILEAASTKQDPNTISYSPAFMYNNIALEDCQGSYIQKAMEFMQTRGAVRYQDFKYDENDCSRQASGALVQQGQQNKIHGFHRLTETDNVNGINVRAVKEHLAKDAPVVIGMMVGGSFMQRMMNQKVWHPTSEDKDMTGFGGHAMCVIGYDDRVEGGAFQIMNSWGNDWGQNGIGFVRYADFKEFVREAYGLDPLPKRGAALNQAFECSIGLFNPDTKTNVALKTAGGNIFKTVTPIKKGNRFKIEIKNAVECYIYIFTPIAGKSTVLFPYKPVHSPYCGITGYRLFPRGQSIQADQEGNKEKMGIVVSKTQLDYNALNAAINASPQADFASKLKAAVAANAITNVSYGNTTNGMMYFKSTGDAKSIVSCVVDIDKQ
jgi:Papain family cysteine protease